VEPVNEWLAEQTKAGSVRLIVNLEGVNFIDSTALSTLVRGLKLCREQNGDLHVCSLLQPVQVIFELTRLDKAFDIFPNEEEAAKGF
jgi:anti-sigma B factor antagonist